MHTGMNTLAAHWLDVSMSTGPINTFRIPTRSAFEANVDNGAFTIIEEVRTGFFRSRLSRCTIQQDNSGAEMLVPLPGFLNDTCDTLLQAEFSKLVHRPCGAEVETAICRGGKVISSVHYTVLPLADEDFAPRYLVIQAARYRGNFRRRHLTCDQKPEKFLGGPPCSSTRDGYEYSIREYLDLGWGTPHSSHAS